jgi:pyruvate,phosphate dikinase
MVFGNLDDRSATGVAFTRDPATGEDAPYGDFLVGAQGEDVVAGTRHPEPLARMADALPAQHAELLRHLTTHERHYRDLCDIEFTVESGRLWMLQTRVGKRSAAAALRIATDMVAEGLIDRREAPARVTPEQLEQLLHPGFGPDAPAPIATGLAASPGAAVGRIALSADDAVAMAADGTPVVLVRVETSPEDLEGMVASRGVLTSRGGLVSHAAVVARGFGIPAVCGAAALRVDEAAGTVTVDGTVLRAGDTISIDGSTGDVVVGAVELVVPEDDPRVAELLAWADEVRTLHVFANADTPDDARRALAAGAEGIGLCRTEHQFLGERLPLVQRVILAATPEEEAAALAPLEARQRADFVELLEVMDGRTVVVRLLDPPLHEFLPDVEELRVAQARGGLDAEGEALLEAASDLREHDPMLGVRGLRLGVLRPALYEAQVRALMTAASDRVAAGGDPRVEIMLPLVAAAGELAWGVELIHRVAAEVAAATGEAVPYTTATMVETPRAALRARAGAARRRVLVRHQRPDPAEVRVLARRRLDVVHPRGAGRRDDLARPVPVGRPARRGPAGRHRRRGGAGRPAGPRDRRLRRARRGPGVDRRVPPAGTRPRVLLGVPRGGGPSGRRPGGAGHRGPRRQRLRGQGAGGRALPGASRGASGVLHRSRISPVARRGPVLRSGCGRAQGSATVRRSPARSAGSTPAPDGRPRACAASCRGPPRGWTGGGAACAATR